MSAVGQAPRGPLARLHIPPPINTAGVLDPKLYSPAIQTARQAGFALGLPPQMLQTPLQTAFLPQLARPGMHRAHPSLVHLAAAGIPPPPVPMTPGGVHQFPPHLLLNPATPFPPPTPGFQQRSRRAPSISTGGPPKAPLGGPQRKTSPLPPGAAGSAAAGATTAGGDAKNKLQKKVIVKLPVERKPAADASEPLWTRTPLPHNQVPSQHAGDPPQIASMDGHPMDWPRNTLPASLDVFLPGKAAWEDIKRAIIEDKLSRLGVGRAAGAAGRLGGPLPHGRAASISSPADPALLLFKLNKLQQAQNASALTSQTGTPSPSLPSVSPQPLGRLQNRHGHSMSMAQPGYFQPHIPGYESGPFNPFGPNALLPPDQVFKPESPGLDGDPVLHAPQGIVPSQASLLLPQSGRTSVASSRPDFSRGFGLEIPEEEEEEEEEVQFSSNIFGQPRPGPAQDVSIASETDRDADGEDDDNEDDGDDATVPARSRIHSRHQSKLSAALSLRSVGGVRSEGDVADIQKASEIDIGDRSFRSERLTLDPTMEDPVNEWTGSEDLRSAANESPDNSDGEWSNPSDEERARQRRLHRRMLSTGTGNETQTPRRLPNFPRPPVNDTFFDAPRARPAMDDDIVSNPSEEEAIRAERSLPGSGRGSGLAQLAPYGAMHSRVGSGQAYPLIASQPQAPAPAPLSASLNPNAKPFVFGSRTSFSAPSFPVPVVPVAAPRPTHDRQLSINSTLNAAAQEFKPTFTFRAPPGVPPLAFPEHPLTAEPRPLPQPPVLQASPGRAMQGREKRIRRVATDDSAADTSDVSDAESKDGHDNIATWSFPFASKAAMPATSGLNPAAKEFTLGGFALPPQIAAVPQPAPISTVSRSASEQEVTSSEHSRSQSDSGSEPAHLALDEFSQPASPAGITPTLPDFRHPISTNKVPASLFKKAAALANHDGDGPTRPNVRSRLSSREIMASLTRRSSLDDLDDLNVPSISRKVSKTMLAATESIAGPQPTSELLSAAAKDLLSPPLSKGPERRSSLVETTSSMNTMSGSFSDDDEDKRISLEAYENRLEDILEDKLEALKRDLVEAKALSNAAPAVLPLEAVNELIEALRTQLSVSNRMQYDESASGGREIDLGVLRSIIEESHLDIQRSLQADLQSMMSGLAVNRVRSPMPGPDIPHLLEDTSSRSIMAIDTVRAQLAARIDSIVEAQRAQRTHLSEVVAQALNMINARIDDLRQPPIDIDLLTAQLSQAVKPNISQLIDLASDKKETAVLIVKHLSPLLESIIPAARSIDTDAVAAQLAAEINRIVPPVDQHTLKEQVADLVVERLDSRLTVRDRANNPDLLASRLITALTPVFEPVQAVTTALQQLTQSHTALAAQTDTLMASHGDYISHVSNIPQSVMAVSETLAHLRSEIAALNIPQHDDRIEPTLATLVAQVQETNRQLLSRSAVSERLVGMYEELQGRVSALPNLIQSAFDDVHKLQAERQGHVTPRRDDEELRSLLVAKAELEKQVLHFQGKSGQLSIEKDSLQDRLATMEAENRLLRAQLEEQRSSAAEREIKTVKAETRANELTESLSQALARLQAVDSSAQAHQKRNLELDAQVRELIAEKHQLRSKVDSLELQVSWAERDKEAALRTVTEAQKERDAMASQQQNWDDLRRTAQHIETLTKLMTSSENEELRELKRMRDRSKVLEGEHQALQKRFKDQETKLANLERASVTARQSLATANQKSADWEKRAKEFESELETARDKLERAEDLRQQVEADYALLKSHVQEKELEEAAFHEREKKLREETTRLQQEVAGLKLSLDQSRAATPPARPNVHAPRPTVASSSSYVMVNGRNDRPSSRETIYPEDARSGANTPRLNGKKKSDAPYVPPADGAWASRHAPASRTVGGMTYFKPPHGRAPSPTPSVISTVTRRDDGWWDAD
ncbi:hypothetical protein AURDEDRAFT_109718 [Auricularia subglabra TFB-10046 SS5]|nr:hypothetical protein AURDEDRAFT_109718 [Auricularia subglabra TFB-10046 SS5]